MAKTSLVWNFGLSGQPVYLISLLLVVSGMNVVYAGEYKRKRWFRGLVGASESAEKIFSLNLFGHLVEKNRMISRHRKKVLNPPLVLKLSSFKDLYTFRLEKMLL